MKKYLKTIGALLLCVTLMGQSVWATDLEVLEQRTRDAEAEAESIEAQKDSAQAEVNSLQAELTELLGQIDQLEMEMVEQGEKITQAEIDLEEAQKTEQHQYEEMKLRIKFMYENRISNADVALSDDSSMDDILNAAGYYQDIYSYDREKLIELDDNVKKIEDLKASLDKALEDTEKNKKEMEDEKKKVTELVKDKEEDLKLINEGISANVMRLYNAGSLASTSVASEALLEIAAKAQEEALKEGKATPKQVEVAQNAGHGRSTYPATYGWCAAWVSGVYSYTGGITPPHGDAIDYWNKWKSSGSTRMDNIPIGACVISSGDPTYGHIGIYLGGGVVASNLGYCKVETIQSFGNVSAVCQGHVGYIGWVWPNGTPIQ